jgi:4-methyl-5(b-hydroxyethyl)-thiazole monophosphate biosynthesis
LRRERAMKIVILLAEGFEEVEFVTIVDILRRADLEVTVAGLEAGPIDGSYGIKVMPDTLLDSITADQFDVVVLPGGYPGFVNLGEDERVLKLLREMASGGKYLTAICGAPSVLAKAGVIEGKRVTIYPGVKDQLVIGNYVDQRVVVDGRVVTSQGPGTAMEFSLKLVELFSGKAKMEAVKADVLAVC